LDEINYLNEHIKRLENCANEKSKMVETLTSQMTNQKRHFQDQISQHRQCQMQQQQKVKQKESNLTEQIHSMKLEINKFKGMVKNDQLQEK